MHPIEIAMARARAEWMLNRAKKLGDGHGEAKGKGLRRDLLGAIAEMATAKIHGVYFDGGAENWNAADVCGYQVRGTKHSNGHLEIFRNDADDQLCLLVLLSRDSNRHVRCTFAGTILAGEGKHDEWFVTPETHPEFLRPGSPDQWWVPQSDLLMFVPPHVPSPL